MNNYRRVFTSSAKFRHVYGEWYLPFWVDTRKTGILAITAIIDIILIWAFKLYTSTTLSIGILLVVGTLVATYQLDNLLVIDNLKFEQTLKYYFKYAWQFRVKKEQIYQGEHSNSSSKSFQFL